MRNKLHIHDITEREIKIDSDEVVIDDQFKYLFNWYRLFDDSFREGHNYVIINKDDYYNAIKYHRYLI